MKITKKLLSVILAMLMIASCTSVAFAAQSFSGAVSGDITIQSGATIGDDAVFSGNITIASGATVNKGTFNGSVANSGTITGGLFKNAVTNNGKINGGTFKGTVTNNTVGNHLASGINNGTFDGSVTNANGATIGGGIFNGSVTNNGEITSSLASIGNTLAFYGVVTNNSKISNGSYYNTVNNSGNITSGIFYGLINNSATVGSSVSAVIKNGSTYTVQGSPIIASHITVSGKDATFNLEKGSYVTISESGQLDLNCACTINGNITLSDGAKLTSNGGSLNGTSAGKISVPMEASFTGTSASKFDFITYKEYPIKVDSNVDKTQFTFSISESAYKGNTVSYSFDLSGSYAGCLVLNNITVYQGRKDDKNIIKKSSDKVSSFTMPDSNVIVYVDCIANHSEKSEHKDATCTTDGYDRTYCETCSHQLSYTKINALGHQFSGWVRNTDPNSKMLKSRTCTRNCGYCEKSYIEIKGYDVQDVTVDYKSTLTFHYNVSAPEGCYIQWIKDNNNAVTANENGFKVSEATQDFKITAKVYGAVTDSYTVTVHVKHGFFDKFVAFFRGLFKTLPVYVDGVKK